MRLIESDPKRLSRLKAESTGALDEILSGILRFKALCSRREDDVTEELDRAPLLMSKDNFKRLAEELVDNAFKFSDPGTPVEVRTFRRGDELVMDIADHGRGMTERQVSQVRAFRQFDRQYYEQQGIGLGLALAKKLAEIHDGRLEISSAPEKGTRVRVFLRIRSE